MYTYEYVPARSNKVGNDIGMEDVARSSGVFIVFMYPRILNPPGVFFSSLHLHPLNLRRGVTDWTQSSLRSPQIHPCPAFRWSRGLRY
jgi:hypothetical protein